MVLLLLVLPVFYCNDIVNFIRLVEKQKKVFVVHEIYMIFPRNNIHSPRVNISLTLTTYVQAFE